MVQGSQYSAVSTAAERNGAHYKDSLNKKMGYDTKQYDYSSKTAAGSSKAESKSHNPSWGPVFKNQQNFINMHFC